MAKRVINIDPLLPKSQYDVTIGRGQDDLEWVAAGATNLVITFLDPHDGMSPGASPKSHKRSFPKSRHSSVAPYKQSTHGAGQIEYVIEVTYPSGTLVIDPFVKILP